MAAVLPNASDENSKICCSTHSDEECTFVCGDCTALICDDCVDTEDHEGHDIKSIKKFIKEVDLDDLKESCEKFDCFKIKAKILDETERRFQKALDGIHSQASKMISEINKIKEKKKRECEEKKGKNATTVNEVLAVVDPSEIADKIDNLPKKGGRTQYAEVAQALLKYHKTMESEEIEAKCDASVYVPTFTHGKIQKSRLEKQFGELDFEEEDVDNLFDTEEETTESESSDDANADDQNNEKGNKEDGEGGSDFLNY
ncbi:uncharacterized protein LOC127714677 [Mytilus californianus]|uniref:uncharacterized protein LOC127714677 n=1 Tax=Mytilus californianus TaxID=6549 RepID=UPI002245A344|nr:uncharacterized protein LOC127714677 [Mytilus californianus]XP_052076701.1 uncharacterized protein LOC127714677 [Mytilus californianus]